MSREDVLDQDATAQARLVREGTLTPLDLVDAAIARIERLNPSINAVILPAFERARDEARRLMKRSAAERKQAAFFGVPLLMKDIGGEEAGAPCHMGMRFLKEVGWTETTDSYLFTRLRDAGFVSLGRTNTPELALLPTTEPVAYGATRNPWNLDRSAGGSSGGAAAAVAAGMVAVAHASDGGGSIRIPAAHCGLVGLKPTRGRNSFGPGRGERWSGFSSEFVVTRNVRDAAALLDLTAGPMPGDPYFAAPPARPYVSSVNDSPTRLRIGLLTHSPRGELAIHPECVAAATKAASLLTQLGHSVEESWPEALSETESLRTYVTIVACSTARTLDAVGAKTDRTVQADDVEPLTWALAEMGRQNSAPEFLAALEYVHSFGRRVAEWWNRGFDLLLTPTTALPAPKIGELVSTREAPFEALMKSAPFGAFTSAFNQTGQPAISLPLDFTVDGLPIGVQLVAAYGREDLLLQVARQIEAAQPWSNRRPPSQT